MTGKPGLVLEKSVAELGLRLSSVQVSSFLSLLAELTKWNSKFNLTSIREDEQVVLKHFVDSLLLLSTVRHEGRLLDIGSGGGFPALPLKIMLPSLEVVSVDAVEKKILFQRQMARVLGLQHFSALHARAEHLPAEYHGSFDWVVTRAFSDLSTFVQLGLPFLKEHGRLVAMKGKRGAEEAKDAENSLSGQGVFISSCVHKRLPVSGDERYLIVMQRIAE